MPNRHNCSPGRWNIHREQIGVSEKSALGITTSFSIPTKFACAWRGRRAAAFFFGAGFSVPICSGLPVPYLKLENRKTNRNMQNCSGPFVIGEQMSEQVSGACPLCSQVGSTRFVNCRLFPESFHFPAQNLKQFVFQ